MHTSPTDLGNAAASALAAAPSGSTFVIVRTPTGLQHALVAPATDSVESVAFAIAKAMNAHSEELDDVPDLTGAPHVTRLAVAAGVTPRPDTMAGADFTVFSRVVGDLLKPGEWVAASIRRPSRAEVKRNDLWLTHHGVRTHHSLVPNATAMQLFAGGTTRQRARDTIVRAASAIPGLGLTVRAETITRAGAVAAFAVSACALTAGGIVWGVSTGIWWPGPGVSELTAAVLATVGAGVATRRLPSFDRTVRTLTGSGLVPVAPRRFGAWHPPKAASTAFDKNTGQHREVPAQDGDYPAAATTFLAGPHIPIALVSPHTGAASGASTTATRSVPGELTERIGPECGQTDGLVVHLPFAKLWGGIGAIGQAGSGKTALLEHLWGFMSAERVHPSGIDEAPVTHALIGFDTKGDGRAAREYATWSAHAGDAATTFHTADREQQEGIDLFPVLPGQSARDWARVVTGALQYAWGPKSIGPQSFDTLTAVLAAALLISQRPDVPAAVTIQNVTQGASPWYYADILLLNQGDDVAVELHAALANAAVQPGADPDGELANAVARLSPLFGSPGTGSGVTPTQRRSLADAPRTKVSALTSAESWWARPVQRSWDELLESNAAVIVNFGKSPSGDDSDEVLISDLASLMLYSLRAAIKRTCDGWFEQNRAVSIFADEVKHIAAVSADVIKWARNDARAYGVRLVIATQTPDTLDPELRRIMLGLAYLILFRQEESQTVREIVDALVLSGADWSTADLVNLRQFEAIIRATGPAGNRLEPFTTRFPDYRAARDAQRVA